MSNSFVHILLAFLLLAVLVFLNFTGALGSILDIGRKGSEILSRPIVAVFVPVKNFVEIATSIKGISRQNEILTLQVAELSADLAALKRTKQENESLREALNFLNESSFELIPAEVITLDRFSQSQRVIINRGRSSGVRQGDAVVVANKVLVGVIASVLEQTSEMEIITSSAITINAWSDSGEATGIVRGEHGLGILFDLVSQNEVIKVGDKLLTSGLGGQFPKNLLIGEVSVNLRNLEVVFVLKQ